jgi:hypothetical protein
MVKKPKPPPLSISLANIEREKLAVLQRTEKRIAAMGILTAANESSTINTPFFPVLVLVFYTAYTFYTQCECTCL